MQEVLHENHSMTVLVYVVEFSISLVSKVVNWKSVRLRCSCLPSSTLSVIARVLCQHYSKGSGSFSLFARVNYSSIVERILFVYSSKLF